MYLAAVVIGNISFSFMLVGVNSVRHNSPSLVLRRGARRAQQQQQQQM